MRFPARRSTKSRLVQQPNANDVLLFFRGGLGSPLKTYELRTLLVASRLLPLGSEFHVGPNQIGNDPQDLVFDSSIWGLAKTHEQASMVRRPCRTIRPL